MKPGDLVEQLLEDSSVYIRVGAPEGYEPEADPSYYGPFNSVAAAEQVIAKFPAFERVDQGVYDYDDGQTQLACNVMIALPTGVGAKLPSAFEGDWAWTIQESATDLGKAAYAASKKSMTPGGDKKASRLHQKAADAYRTAGNHKKADDHTNMSSMLARRAGVPSV